jgi:hypothetical protein
MGLKYNRKVSNWLMYSPNGSRMSSPIRNELGWFGRHIKDHHWRKTHDQTAGQLLNKGHGKIPMERVCYGSNLTVSDLTRRLNTKITNMTPIERRKMGYHL